MITENLFEAGSCSATRSPAWAPTSAPTATTPSCAASERLSGAPVRATDIRAGVGLVLAGLVADGRDRGRGGPPHRPRVRAARGAIALARRRGRAGRVGERSAADVSVASARPERRAVAGRAGVVRRAEHQHRTVAEQRDVAGSPCRGQDGGRRGPESHVRPRHIQDNEVRAVDGQIRQRHVIAPGEVRRQPLGGLDADVIGDQLTGSLRSQGGGLAPVLDEPNRIGQQRPELRRHYEGENDLGDDERRDEQPAHQCCSRRRAEQPDSPRPVDEGQHEHQPRQGVVLEAV